MAGSAVEVLIVPRLELQAALLGARLIQTFEKEIDFKISKRVLWSDSIMVLRWIKTEPRARNTGVSPWRYQRAYPMFRVALGAHRFEPRGLCDARGWD